VIVDSDDSYEILEVTFDGGWGELSTDAAANAQELWLVVGAWTETLVNSRWEDEEFDYRYAILVDETLEPTPDTGEPEESEDTDEAGNEGMPELTNWSAGEDPEIIACGCAHSPPSRGYLALVLGFIGFAGRRHYR
jgi:hypothetical protein